MTFRPATFFAYPVLAYIVLAALGTGLAFLHVPEVVYGIFLMPVLLFHQLLLTNPLGIVYMGVTLLLLVFALRKRQGEPRENVVLSLSTLAALYCLGYTIWFVASKQTIFWP